MSQLTAILLGGKRVRRSSKRTALLGKVANRLVKAYGHPTLGNYRDPVKEIFFIVLSARTSEVLYKRACRKLFHRFRTISELADARIAEVAQCIQGAGLGRKRSRQVVAIAKQLVADFGPRPQRKLRSMSAEDAYTYLIGLPGLGPKSALCVMMYSLDFDVFPVDANVQRIAERLGAIRRNAKHYQAQHGLPRHVPQRRSRDLHVGMVVHGRVVCRPKQPVCEECVLLDLCRTGIRRRRIQARKKSAKSSQRSASANVGK